MAKKKVKAKINKAGTILLGLLSERQKTSLYKRLEKIGGKGGSDSWFQKSADKIRGWKPYAFTRILMSMLTSVFKLPWLTKLAAKAFSIAKNLQVEINSGKIKSSTAGKRLRAALNSEGNFPSWLVNFLSEAVVLAIRLVF